MTKTTLALGLLLLAPAATMPAAPGEVKLQAKDADGKETGVAKITLDSRIRFTDRGVAVLNGEAQTALFPYTETAKLSFLTDGSGIAPVNGATQLRLVNNPVGDTLEFAGCGEEGGAIAVYDLNGSLLLINKEWKGEPTDVSALTPGIYLATVNNTTFKFIKK